VSPYQVLGVEPTATQQEIGKAYRQLAGIYHPDKNPGNPKAAVLFKDVSEAYQILGDPEKRAAFDRYGDLRHGAPQAPGTSSVTSPATSPAQNFVEDLFSALGFAVELGKPKVAPMDGRRMVDGFMAAGRVAGKVADVLLGEDEKEPPKVEPPPGRREQR
jgi:DnaJ-class molecular chaperone